MKLNSRLRASQASATIRVEGLGFGIIFPASHGYSRVAMHYGGEIPKTTVNPAYHLSVSMLGPDQITAAVYCPELKGKR